jgi:type IV pilus assembly protein PilA
VRRGRKARELAREPARLPDRFSTETFWTDRSWGNATRLILIVRKGTQMLARIRKSIEEKDEGFTLIELLVVMIIIGILAAIAIPVFLSQRQKGYDASVKSDLRTIANELESYNTDYQAYPASTASPYTMVTAAGVTTVATGDTIRTSNGNSFAYVVGTNSYCIIGVNTKGTRPWEYLSAAGGLQAAATVPAGSVLPTAPATQCGTLS